MDDFAGGVGAGCAGEAVAGMRAGAAEEKAADGRFVASPIENGAHGEKLVEGEFAMENVAAGEAVDRFEVERSDDLHVLHEAGKIGRVLGESFDDGVAEIFAAGVPVPFLQLVRRELDVSGEDVLAFRGKRRIEKRGNGDIEIRGAGENSPYLEASKARSR